MDGFVYMSLVSRLEHYDQIAREMVRERRNVERKEQEAVRLVMAVRPVEPVRLPEEKSA
jgi:hypothetical protein